MTLKQIKRVHELGDVYPNLQKRVHDTIAETSSVISYRVKWSAYMITSPEKTVMLVMFNQFQCGLQCSGSRGYICIPLQIASHPV